MTKIDAEFRDGGVRYRASSGERSTPAEELFAKLGDDVQEVEVRNLPRGVRKTLARAAREAGFPTIEVRRAHVDTLLARRGGDGTHASLPRPGHPGHVLAAVVSGMCQQLMPELARFDEVSELVDTTTATAYTIAVAEDAGGEVLTALTDAGLTVRNVQRELGGPQVIVAWRDDAGPRSSGS